MLGDLPAPFLLLGDFKGRHPLCSDCIYNPQTLLLASLVEDKELATLNSGEITDLHSQMGVFTANGLLLCLSTARLDFSLKVFPDLPRSDHFPIIWTSSHGEPRTRLPLWRIQPADW